jgi:hypothetical protein
MGVQVFGGFRSISIPLNCFMMKLEILRTESRYVCLYASFNLGYVLTAQPWDANKMTQSFVYCMFFKLLWLNYYCALKLLFLLNSCIYRALSKQCLSRVHSLYPPFPGFLWKITEAKLLLFKHCPSSITNRVFSLEQYTYGFYCLSCSHPCCIAQRLLRFMVVFQNEKWVTADNLESSFSLLTAKFRWEELLCFSQRTR